MVKKGERTPLPPISSPHGLPPVKPSGFKGVRKRSWGRWVSEIRIPHSRDKIWLGSYPTPEQAARAYDVAALLLRGSASASSFLNFTDSASIAPSPLQPGLLSRRTVQATAAALACASPLPQFSSSLPDLPSSSSSFSSSSPSPSSSSSRSSYSTLPMSLDFSTSAATPPPPPPPSCIASPTLPSTTATTASSYYSLPSPVPTPSSHPDTWAYPPPPPPPCLFADSVFDDLPHTPRSQAMVQELLALLTSAPLASSAAAVAPPPPPSPPPPPPPLPPPSNLFQSFDHFQYPFESLAYEGFTAMSHAVTTLKNIDATDSHSASAELSDLWTGDCWTA